MRPFQAGLTFKDENPSDGILKSTAIAKTPPIGMYGRSIMSISGPARSTKATPASRAVDVKSSIDRSAMRRFEPGRHTARRHILDQLRNCRPVSRQVVSLDCRADDLFPLVIHPAGLRSTALAIHQRHDRPTGSKQLDRRYAVARLISIPVASSAASAAVILPGRCFRNSRIPSARRHAASQRASSISSGNGSLIAETPPLTGRKRIGRRPAMPQASTALSRHSPYTETIRS